MKTLTRKTDQNAFWYI